MKSLTPRDCAIVVAVPTSRAEFHAAARPTDPESFVARLIGVADGRFLRRIDWVWRHHYKPIAEHADRVLTRVADMGVEVVRRARVADLARVLSGRAQAITIVAHWRFPGLSPHEIVDADGVLRAVLAAETWPLRHIRDQLPRAPTAAQAVDYLCSEVRASEASERRRELGTGEVRGEVRGSPGDSVHRVDLELALPSDALPHAGVIEFGCGFQPLSSLLAAIPPDFAGVLDLSICNSALLARTLRALRRRCIVAVNRRESNLSFSLARYFAVIRLLHATGRPFLEAVHSIHSHLIREVP